MNFVLVISETLETVFHHVFSPEQSVV